MQTKKPVTAETYVTLGVFALLFGYMTRVMGTGNFFNTLMRTAHDLILQTVLFIMGIAILAGAFAAILSEFGVIDLLNRLITPLMRPLYDLPGAAARGVLTTFLSDNPAIISLAHDEGFRKYFRPHELPALCNLGTAFGMGFIVWTFMASQGEESSFFLPATIGVVGAIVGSIVSVRIMLRSTKKYFGESSAKTPVATPTMREVREGSAFSRALEAALDGGKSGVDMGIAILPGVVIICTIVLMLTMEVLPDATGKIVYTGAAYEGVGLIPKVGKHLMFLLEPLYGFTSPEAIAFPLTSLGAVGAAMSMVPRFLSSGLIGANDIAVFTAMGMCFSGYLSTHIAMMDALHVRKLAPKAIFAHTIGGIVAGIVAHYLYLLTVALF